MSNAKQRSMSDIKPASKVMRSSKPQKPRQQMIPSSSSRQASKALVAPLESSANIPPNTDPQPIMSVPQTQEPFIDMSSVKPKKQPKLGKSKLLIVLLLILPLLAAAAAYYLFYVNAPAV